MFLNEEKFSLVTIMGFGTSKPSFSTATGEKGVLVKGTNIIDSMEQGQLTYEWNDIKIKNSGATMNECVGGQPGDQGSPAFIVDKGEYVLAGVHCKDKTCFKRIADHYDWIVDTVGKDD